MLFFSNPTLGVFYSIPSGHHSILVYSFWPFSYSILSRFYLNVPFPWWSKCEEDKFVLVNMLYPILSDPDGFCPIGPDLGQQVRATPHESCDCLGTLSCDVMLSCDSVVERQSTVRCEGLYLVALSCSVAQHLLVTIQ